MHDTDLYPLTWRLARRRMIASPLAWCGALILPALVAWTGLKGSYEAAAKLFLFAFPHVFLLAAQDVVRTDIESGALENVLFLGGRFRRFLWAKNVVVAGTAGAYCCALFAGLAAWGVASGGFEAFHLIQFALGLLAGLYYVGAAGAMSYFFRAGSNVLAVLLAQSAVFLGVLFSATARTGFVESLAAGRFPGLGSKLVAGGLVALVPNLVVSRRLSVFGLEVLAGLALAAFVQRRLSGRLELGR